MARLFLAPALAFVVLAFAVSKGLTEEPKPEAPDLEALAKTFAKASQPGPEHDKLKPLAGEWTYTGKFWMVPEQSPIEMTGTIQREWILGDRFLEERVMGDGFDGKSKFEGRGMLGYDKQEKKYTNGFACTMCTGITTSVGTSDASGKEFTFETEAFCPLRGKKVKGRDELRIISKDKHVIASYQTDDGKEHKVMELTVTRQK